MKVVLENIASISEASIEISNLTVLSGENDTGKTTIAKVIYALGQATSSFKYDYLGRQEYEMSRLYDELYMRLTRYLDKNTLRQNKDQYNELYSPQDSNVDKNLSEDLFELLNMLRRSPGYRNLSNSDFVKLEGITKELLKNELLTPSIFVNIQKSIENIKEKIVELDKNLPTSTFIYNALQSEFSDEIVKDDCENSTLKLFDGEHKVFKLSFDNNRIIDFEGDDLLRISDSTLIEGPAIFQIATMFGRRMAFPSSYLRFRGNELGMPYHMIDLCTKLNGTRDTLAKFVEESICDEGSWDLSEFYDGYVSYEGTSELFKLIKDDKSYHGNNISSGVKALAILDLLIRGNYITTNSVLIFDEPETNLHPSWQKKYAKAIVNLAARGAMILVNTHSPYMLEALKIYSDKEDSDLFESKFYFASKKEGNISFSDTNGDISIIISALSEPLYELIEESQGDIDEF